MIGIVLMSPFSWWGQKVFWLSLAFIIDWRVVPFLCAHLYTVFMLFHKISIGFFHIIFNEEDGRISRHGMTTRRSTSYIFTTSHNKCSSSTHKQHSFEWSPHKSWRAIDCRRRLRLLELCYGSHERSGHYHKCTHTIIAVQWVKAHKTDNRTAYSTANTQPTACSKARVFKNNAS